MHDHDVVHVIDPVVLVVVVAQAAERRHGFFAGLLTGELATEFFLVIETHQIMGYLDQMCSFGYFGFAYFFV